MGQVRDTTGIEAALEMLRLRLRRYVLWLRQRWAETPVERYQGIAITDVEAESILDASNTWAERAAFYRSNLEAVALTRLLEAGAAGEGHSPLRNVQDLFLLSDFERACLLLAVAVELDPGFERLYAYVQDDAGLLLPTPGLAVALFSSGSAEAISDRNAFAGDRPLFRYALLEWAGPGKGGVLSRPFRMDERILGFLTGSSLPDQRISRALTVLREESLAVDLFAGQCARLEARLRAFLSNQQGGVGRIIVNLRGGDAASCRSIAAEVGRRLGIAVLRCSMEELQGVSLSAVEMLPFLFREALLQPAALYLELPAPGADRGDAPMETAGPMLRAVSDFAALTFVVSERHWPPRLTDLPQYGCARVELAVPALDYAGRFHLWQAGLQRLGSSFAGSDATALAKELANRFHFGSEQITAALQRAAEAAALRRGGVPEAADIEAAARTMPVHNLDALAQKVESPFTWEDIVLPEDSREQLMEVATHFRYRQKVYGEWGFEAKMDRGRGICVLFSGPSGTGKTMAAEILANDLGLELYRIDLSAVVSKYIGETEKNLRKVFDEGEKSQTILFFDEADALFGKRSEVRDSHDRYANIEINYLLQRMESYAGASILATNMRAAIDPAFLRRLRTIIEFPMPDVAQREAIWRKSFPAAATPNGVDFRLLAKHFPLSGGNIKNAALNAAFFAAADGGAITMDHVAKAVRREYAKMGKICTVSGTGKYL
jgi:AAA+ superfamily predicted ATPase